MWNRPLACVRFAAMLREKRLPVLRLPTATSARGALSGRMVGSVIGSFSRGVFLGPSSLHVCQNLAASKEYP